MIKMCYNFFTFCFSLQTDDINVSTRMEDMINSESTLLQRVHTLEQSERALREGFRVKEQEYESTIRRLNDKILLTPEKKKLVTNLFLE